MNRVMKTTMIIVAFCVAATLRSFGQSPSKGNPYCTSEPMHKLDQRLSKAQPITTANGGCLSPGMGSSYGAVSSRGQAYHTANAKPAAKPSVAPAKVLTKEEQD